jgi:hypothetical protein
LRLKNRSTKNENNPARPEAGNFLDKRMVENKFKVSSKSRTGSSGTSIFSGLEKKLKLETYFEEGFPVQYVPKILFVMLLGLLYIGNTHHAEKTVRKINSIRAEVEDLRADYTTLKADLMFSAKQSEVAKKVKDLGLEPNLVPPQKIVIKEGEY